MLTLRSSFNILIKCEHCKVGLVSFRTFTSSIKMTTQETTNPTSVQAQPQSTGLVMQLIVDTSLFERQPNWSLGPMMAQAGHATSAIIAKTYNQPNTQSYLSETNLPNMRKVVLKTGKGISLETLSEKLKIAAEKAQTDQTEQFPDHHLWIEQPENIPTVLAIAPNTRPSVSGEKSQ